MDRRLTGILGEDAAAKYYRAQGYLPKAANYRTRQGEIDLIVEKNKTLVFVEVKTRAPDSLVSAAEAVTATKQHRILLAAKFYLQQIEAEPSAIRFDVVEVVALNGEILSLNCIENAFGE